MPNESLAEVVCDFRRSFRLVFMISLLAIVVLIPSALAVVPGTGTYVITMVQLATFAVLLVAASAAMVFCGRRPKA